MRCYKLTKGFICKQCPRQCGVLRTDDYSGVGMCGMPRSPVIARAATHTGEEPCISGQNGSGTIFFSGCSLRCLFCQNEPISQQRFGKEISINRLIDIIRELEKSGVHNINFVNPTHYAHVIRETLMQYKPAIPVIYNSGGYERVETIRSLDGLIDVYLPDCKYVSSDISEQFSGAKDYFSYAAPAILEMARQTGPVILNENGIIRKGTIVRHLVLPGHIKESETVLDWLAANKDLFWVSLMFQYTPMGNTQPYKELQRPLTARECHKIWEYMNGLGIENGYVQDRKSSGAAMIPTFDLTGV